MAHQNAIIIFTKPTQLSRRDSKEPFASLTWDDVDKLFSACTVDLLQQAGEVPDADVFFYRNPEEAMDEYLYPLREKITFCNIIGKTLNEQACAAVEKAYAERYNRVIVMLDNHPTINRQLLDKVFEQLKYEDECVVVGPTVEGKCFLIGMKSNQSRIFEHVKDDSLQKQFVLFEQLCLLEGMLFLLPQRYLLDSGSHIARLREEVARIEEVDDLIAFRTREVFKKFDKKYRMKLAVR